MNEAMEASNKYAILIDKYIKGVEIEVDAICDGEDVYVIEVNSRASRTVLILSKVTGVPMVKLAVDAMLGKKLKKKVKYEILYTSIFKFSECKDAGIIFLFKK